MTLGRSRPALAVMAAAASGLFLARLLGDFVPDALAIGVCMFATGIGAGFMWGATTREGRSGRAFERGLRRLGRRLEDHDDE